MTIWQAWKQFALDIPNVLVALATSTSAWLVATSMGFEPDAPETIWFGLCSAGFYYHLQGMRELLIDRQALRRWPATDDVDLEANSDAVRQESTRLATKGLFSLAGLIMMFLPPRLVPEYEATTRVVIALLTLAVVALDIDAVLKRRSRRRQMDLLKVAVERRRRRREELEFRFRPLLEQFASAASRQGRDLAHQIKNQMAIAAGAVEVLKTSDSVTPDNRQTLVDADIAIDLALDLVDKLHELVRTLDTANRETVDGDPTSRQQYGG